MSLPVMKLGTLAVRTLSKPIATRLKKQAAVSPKFRTSIIGIAQANHWLTTTIQRRIYGRATNVEVRPLNEERAVQAAGDLIGELFVFTVAGAVVIFEVQRSARSEAKKEGIRKKEIEVLMQRDEDLTKQVQLLEQKLNQLEQITKEKALTCVVNLENNQNKAVKTAISSS
ncbi:OPA3-like protein [Bidens hawaiensis]|uniref:OPA3-like protein n=1 Tax=Bidens hawaiensis TaxID=980011 RepID=UPI004049ADBE